MDVYAPAQRHRRPSPPIRTPRREIRSKAESRRWLEEERVNLVALAGSAADHGWAEHASRLSGSLHRYLANGLYGSDGLALHRSALRAARECGDHAGEARALSHLGDIYRNLGSHRSSLECLRAALECLSRSGSDEYRAEVYDGLGHVLMHMGHFSEAIGSCEQAIALYRECGDPFGEVKILCDLGDLARHVGRFDDASRYGRAVLSLVEGTDNRAVEVNGLRLLGLTCCATARYAEALDYLRRSLSLSQEIGHRHGEYFALSGCSRSHRRSTIVTASTKRIRRWVRH